MDEIIGKLIRLYYEHQTDEVWCVNIFGIPNMEFVPFELKDLGMNDLLIGQKVIDTVKNVISPFELFPLSSHPDGSSEYPSMKVHYIHSIPNDNVIVSLCMYQFKPLKQYFNDEKLVFGIGERPTFAKLFDSNCMEEFNFNLLEESLKKCEQLAVENKKISDQYEFDKKKFQAYYMLESIKNDFN